MKGNDESTKNMFGIRITKFKYGVVLGTSGIMKSEETAELCTI